MAKTFEVVTDGVTSMLEAFIGQGGSPGDFGQNISVTQLTNLIHNNLFPKIKATRSVDIVLLNKFAPFAQIVTSSGELIEDGN